MLRKELIHCKQSVSVRLLFSSNGQCTFCLCFFWAAQWSRECKECYPHHIVCSPPAPQHWWPLGLLKGSPSARNSQPSRVPDFTQPISAQSDHCLCPISRLPQLARGRSDGSHSVLLDGAYGVCHGLAVLHQCQLQDALLCPWPGFQWVSAYVSRTHIDTDLVGGDDGNGSNGESWFIWPLGEAVEAQPACTIWGGFAWLKGQLAGGNRGRPSLFPIKTESWQFGSASDLLLPYLRPSCQGPFSSLWTT